MLPVRSLTAVAMVAVLACATPAWAATAPVANREAAVALPGPQAGAAPAPTSPPPAAHDDAFPWIALAPLGLATGYVWTGRWERVVRC